MFEMYVNDFLHQVIEPSHLPAEVYDSFNQRQTGAGETCYDALNEGLLVHFC